jgi:hypothetical protein
MKPTRGRSSDCPGWQTDIRAAGSSIMKRFTSVMVEVLTRGRMIRFTEQDVQRPTAIDRD